jgi:hypothetical protein
MTGPYDVLSRVNTGPSTRDRLGERCEMCTELITDKHQHVVNLAARQLLCVCRACYLLFTDIGAKLKYRAVPERYLVFPDFALDRRSWEALQVPVGVAFFFRNSALDRTVAFYPGPAGATESELHLDVWAEIEATDPRAKICADDTEALLVRVPDEQHRSPQCYLVPIDACYEFVGRLRTLWRGFDGGREARAYICEFFDGIAGRATAVTL